MTREITVKDLLKAKELIKRDVVNIPKLYVSGKVLKKIYPNSEYVEEEIYMLSKSDIKNHDE